MKTGEGTIHTVTQNDFVYISKDVGYIMLSARQILELFEADQARRKQENGDFDLQASVKLTERDAIAAEALQHIYNHPWLSSVNDSEAFAIADAVIAEGERK